MGTVINKMRKSAKGQDCTFNLHGVCNHNPETTVLCHAPSPVKGMGNKGDDWFAAFGCSDCHRYIDEQFMKIRNEPALWLQAVRRTWAVWIDMGLIVLPAGTKPKDKKALPPRSLFGKK